MKKHQGQGYENNLVRKARRGSLTSQLDLAVAYATGDGLEMDLERSRHWYQKAAEQGNSDAAFNYAVMLLDGVGGDVSRRNGMRWLKFAASNESTDALILLADICKSEKPKPRLSNACKYWAQALRLGDMRGAREFAATLARVDDPASRARLSKIFTTALGFKPT